MKSFVSRVMGLLHSVADDDAVNGRDAVVRSLTWVVHSQGPQTASVFCPPATSLATTVHALLTTLIVQGFSENAQQTGPICQRTPACGAIEHTTSRS